jgi:hypothetical protein
VPVYYHYEKCAATIFGLMLWTASDDDVGAESVLLCASKVPRSVALIGHGGKQMVQTPEILLAGYFMLTVRVFCLAHTTSSSPPMIIS